jgi:hypothetical protein
MAFQIGTVLASRDFNNTILDDYYRQYLFDVKIFSSVPSEVFKGSWMANAQTPYSTTGVQEIDFLHTKIKQAGRTITQQWVVNVRDDSGNKAFEFFNSWRNKIYNFDIDRISASVERSSLTTPDRYKYRAIVELLSPTTNSIKNRAYELMGVWPLEVGAITLDYNAGEISTFPVTLAVDYFVALTGAKYIYRLISDGGEIS